ncbi:MAG: MarR family transcriptional regulator [Chloroflexi bacterium]|nr:MAG: MarR family transcriptional regulator [Chloroflexota bacterium]TMD64869.1 MAG: MarR family transcriptional regulator [Chloroflexota bacterium]
MNRLTMEQSEIKWECRFNGALATDRAGRLYDARFRQAIHATRRPLSEKEIRAVEAMTALRITARLSRQLMDRWAETHGLSEGRIHVLFRLADAPGHQLPLGELAEQLDVTARNVTGLIDHLERDGLVERVDDPDDRRSTYARLTAAGGKRLDSLRGEGLYWQMKIASGLSTEELELLRHACLKLIENMTGAPVATGRTA